MGAAGVGDRAGPFVIFMNDIDNGIVSKHSKSLDDTKFVSRI